MHECEYINRVNIIVRQSSWAKKKNTEEKNNNVKENKQQTWIRIVAKLIYYTNLYKARRKLNNFIANIV